MTKVFYLLCIVLISIIVLLMYLKPDQHKSIAALQVEALTQAKSEQHPLRTATLLDHRDQPYLVVLNQIQKYINGKNLENKIKGTQNRAPESN